MRFEHRSTLEVERDLERLQRKVNKEMRELEKIETKSEAKKEKVDNDIEERSAVYRHLGVHILMCQLFLEGKGGTYREELAKSYTESIHELKQTLELAPVGELRTLLERKLDYLEIIEASILIENAPPVALLIALVELDKEIDAVSNKE